MCLCPLNPNRLGDVHKAASDKRTSANAIWAFMVSHLFVICLCAYADILEMLALVSRLFQLQYITYRTVSSAVHDLINSLQMTYLQKSSMGGVRLTPTLQRVAPLMQVCRIGYICM
mgnify:CR=1 FL=1